VEFVAKGFKGFAELLAGFLIHLVIDQPHGHLGDPGWPLLDLDAVHLVDVHANDVVDLDQPMVREQCLDDFMLQPPQLAIGNHKKVAAAASGVTELEPGQLVVELHQVRPLSPRLVEFRPQVVEEQGADQLHDVPLGRVVGPDLTAATGAGLASHDGLEKGTEHGGADLGPLKLGCVK
jgi:hypothetical protein